MGQWVWALALVLCISFELRAMDCPTRLLRGGDAIAYLKREKPRLRIASANLLRLLEETGPYGFPVLTKSDLALRDQGRALREIDADILFVQETDRSALARFNKSRLAKQYRMFLVDGLGSKKMQVGVLVRKTLPLTVEERSFRNERWGTDGPYIFERNVPALIFRLKGEKRPLFVGLGVHLKSKNGEGNDDGTMTRMTQADRLRDITRRLQVEFGENLPLFMTGDFNGDVNEDPTYEPLHRAGLVDAFQVMGLAGDDRVTHTYHPNGTTVHSQLDYLLLSPAMRPYLASAWAYRYKNDDGTVRPFPKSQEERDKNPSDHYPIVMEIDLARMLDSWLGV